MEATVETPTMKIYLEHKGDQHRVYVSPGKHFPNVTDWMDDDKKPIQFEVLFKHGVCVVDQQLGKYMVDRGLAQTKARSIIDHFLPGFARKANA